MSTPPPGYETVISEKWQYVDEKQSSSNVPRWNIREAVAVSRTQHVASIVEQILPQIKSRAERGFGFTDFILIPSDAEDARDGAIVGLNLDRRPLVVQFEGSQNTSAFWSQDGVRLELEKQLISAVSTEDIPSSLEKQQQHIVLETPRSDKRSNSWFGRRAMKESQTQPSAIPARRAPVTVIVHLDDVNIRKENDYGIPETRSIAAVFVSISVS